MPEIVDLSNVLQTAKEYTRIVNARLTNAIVATYYEDMAELAKMDGDLETHRLCLNKAISIRDCHKHMFFDHYETFKVKDYKRTIFCHDRFCPLCQKLKANTREKKFYEILADLEPQYDFYHGVLTFPNVPVQTLKRAREGLRSGLSEAISRMFEAFKKLTRYFTGNAAVADMNFRAYGYAGAIRTLEITFTSEHTFHCHFHFIAAMKKGLYLPGKTINKYSYNKYTGKITPFSDFEILLQKLWRLLMDGKKVTKANIDAMRLGYSCMFKKILPDESHDVFKYIVKPDDNATMTFEMFRDLSTALKGKRSIQTYGCFHGYKLEDEAIDESDDPLYDHIVEAFRKYDMPYECMEAPEKVKENIEAKKFLYISRKSVRSFIRHMGYDDEDDFSFRLAVPEKAMQYLQTVMPGILDRPVSLACFDGGRPIVPRKSD